MNFNLQTSRPVNLCQPIGYLCAPIVKAGEYRPQITPLFGGDAFTLARELLR
jgi:hypothetical protein